MLDCPSPAPTSLPGIAVGGVKAGTPVSDCTYTGV